MKKKNLKSKNKNMENVKIIAYNKKKSLDFGLILFLSFSLILNIILIVFILKTFNIYTDILLYNQPQLGNARLGNDIFIDSKEESNPSEVNSFLGLLLIAWGTYSMYTIIKLLINR